MIYIMHFSRPYYHARHYIGSSPDPVARVREHLSGRGSPLVRAVVNAGIAVHAWVIRRQGGRRLERHIKNQKHSERFCPLCSSTKSIRQIV